MLLGYIDLDIPQTRVLPQANYTSISKRFLNEVNDMFLWSYLGQKFAEYSVKNYYINEQLREIYLIHHLQKSSRQEEEMYDMDEKHYKQLFYTDQVCKSISWIASELVYIIYFMKQIKITGALPAKTDAATARDFIITHTEFKNSFMGFSGFLDKIDAIRLGFNISDIRPVHDFLLLEDEPTYFVMGKNDQTSVYLLRNFIHEYNSFFHLALVTLANHSPAAISSGLSRWLK